MQRMDSHCPWILTCRRITRAKRSWNGAPTLTRLTGSTCRRESGRCREGAMHVHFGKSDNARRTVPLSPRCATLLDIRRGNRREHGPFRRRPGAGTRRKPRSRGNTGKPSGITKAEGFSFYALHHNLGTAVAEPDGRLVRFHPRFPGFAREYNFMPRACNPASGWEKGKVERGGIGNVAPEFPAVTRVHRPARCEPPGATVVGRGGQSAPPS